MLRPINEIHVALGLQPSGDTMKFLIDDCKNRMNKYVPKKDNFLRRSARSVSDGVVYESPYAEVQYKGERGGIPFTHYTTPGTGPRWDERMMSAERQYLIRDIHKYIERKLS